MRVFAFFSFVITIVTIIFINITSKKRELKDEEENNTNE